MRSGQKRCPPRGQGNNPVAWEEREQKTRKGGGRGEQMNINPRSGGTLTEGRPPVGLS